MEAFDQELLWLVIVSFIVAFILSFGIGANDVANSFGTSVGSKVITIKAACIIATIFEIAGAVLIGYKVSDTMRKVVHENLYVGSEKELMMGYLSALGGSGIWLLLATFFNLPISGTHSIVGATVGFSLVTRGFNGLHWTTFVGIVSSWFISPLLSGCISTVLFLLIGHFILNSPKPIRNGLRALPLFYGLTIAINIFSVVHGGSKLINLHNVSLVFALLCGLLVGIISAVIVHFFVVPRQYVNIIMSLPSAKGNSNNETDITEPIDENEISAMAKPINIHFQLDQSFEDISLQDLEVENKSPQFTISKSSQFTNRGMTPSNSALPLIKNAASLSPRNEDEKLDIGNSSMTMTNISNTASKVESIFSFLQILTAIFGSFAHGGNDVSNAIGPLVAIWLVYSEGCAVTKGDTPLFILLFGGVGISVGLCLWGRRVIKTIGEDLTKLTPSTGFSIEIGAAMTVLLASKVGVPISTTHCKVGSVVLVGCVNSSKGGVDWKLFRHIVYAWVVTVPVAAFFSAIIMLALEKFPF